MTAFGCKLAEADLVRGCAPAQPDEVQAGQEWMSVESGATYPVSSATPGRIVLGSDSYKLVCQESYLREHFVCVDAPDNVVTL